MASLDAEMEKMKFRQNYQNHWHTDLLRAPQSDPLLVLVHRTFSENELYTMICQGIHVVEAICLVVADVEKVIAPSCVFVQRSFFALLIQLPQRVLCCKTSSIFRQQNAIIA